MVDGDYILHKSNGTTIDEKIVAAAVNYVLGFDANKNPIMLGKSNLHGIESSGTLAFSNATHEVTLASATYWYKGEKVVVTSLVCDLDLTTDRDNSSNTLSTNKEYFIYFKDTTGKLYWSDSSWNFKENVFVCTVFWNGSAGAVQNERHNHTRDLDWHEWAHDTVGLRYQGGSDKTNPTTTNDALLQIETGSYHDEDLDFATGKCTTMRGWYQVSAGVYTFGDYALPYIGTTGQPQYLRTSDYSLRNVGASNFACYWVYASNDIDRHIYIIPTQAAADYTTLPLARAETAPSLANFNINPDYKIIYRFIYKGDGNFQESADYRSSSPLPSGGTPSVSAGAVSYVPSGNPLIATNVQGALDALALTSVTVSATAPATPFIGQLWYDIS